jgi:iron complex outermembrane recepter protein
MKPMLYAGSIPMSFLRGIIVIILSTTTTTLFSQQPDTLYATQSLKHLSLEELMNIQVTSVSKHAEKLLDAPSAIQVITAEHIRQSGVTTLPEALRLASNLQVAKVNASQWAISARGFNNVLADKLLVMIDGRSVYTPLYAGVYWDVQNVMLEDVDRIEVISGPGGTLWGANAVNGVINIVTKKAQNTQGLFAEAGSGNQLPWMANARYGGTIGKKVYYRIYGMGQKQSDTRALTDGKTANDKWSFGQGGFRLDWDQSTKNKITLQGDFYDGYPNPDGATPVVTMGGNVLARWSHTTSEKSDWQVQAYYDHTWRDLLNGFTEKLQTLDLDWAYRFGTGRKHEWTWGGDIRMMDDRMHNLELFAFEPAQKKLHLYGTFVQDKITLVQNKLSLTAGTKVEHNNYTGIEWSPTARVSWTPNSKQTIWTAASRAVRTPSRIDQDFTLSIAPGVPFIKGSTFRAETMVAYEAGWRIQLQSNLSMTVSSFYNQYDYLRSVEPGPPPIGIPVTFSNGVKGHSYGAEISANWQITQWWHMRGGYTFVEKNLKVKEGSADMNEASAESNDPCHQVMTQSLFNWNRWNAGFVFRWIDALPDPFIPAYSALDMKVGWMATKHIELSVVGQNVLDERHLEFIPNSPSARLMLRSVYGKITCRL